VLYGADGGMVQAAAYIPGMASATPTSNTTIYHTNPTQLLIEDVEERIRCAKRELEGIHEAHRDDSWQAAYVADCERLIEEINTLGEMVV
jgi:hypothetical protein